MCRWDTLHNTCYRGEQDDGHSWCNGLVAPDSWHNLVHRAHMYSGHNLKVSLLLLYPMDNFIDLDISAC
jgi:hypothetical protein